MKQFTAIILGFILIILDQFLKWWMISYHPSLVLENKGIVLGFIENSLIGYSLLAVGLAVLLWLIWQNRNLIAPLSLPPSLIVAGAISNLLDRIFHGYIVDYFNFFNLNHFNLADIYIFSGVLFYIYLMFRKENYR